SDARKTALPNLQPAGAHVGERSALIAPVGFGPIAPTWPPRRARLGKHAEVFPRAGWPLQPMPAIDPLFFNAAPTDQHLDVLRGNERLVLQTRPPTQPRLVTNLPGVQPRAFLQPSDGKPEELQLTCDTLWIDTDRGVASLAWRAQISRPPRRARVFVVTET